jgi:hypothetical protein
MDKSLKKRNFLTVLLALFVGLFLGYLLAAYLNLTTENQSLHQISKEKIIRAVAKKLNYKTSDVVIGVPFIETVDWVSINAGNKNFGGGMNFIFKKSNNELEVIYNGQECPSSQVIQDNEIPDVLLSSSCKQ